MDTSESNPPYEYLTLLERKCNVATLGLPGNESGEQQWNGVLFCIGDYELVASMTDIIEISDVPPLTHIPKVKQWVLGLSNMRGNLLLIIDLANFLLPAESRAKEAGQLLVIRHEGSPLGLRVDKVVGMRHYPETDRTGDTPHLPASLNRFVTEGFVDQDKIRPVFSFTRLTQDPLFQDATV